MPPIRFTSRQREDRITSHVTMACKLPKVMTRKQRMALRFIVNAFGGGFGSVLWDALREKKQLTYTFSMQSADLSPHAQYLVIAADPPSHNTVELVETIQDAIQNFSMSDDLIASTRESLDDAAHLGIEESMNSWCELTKIYIRHGKALKSLPRHFTNTRTLIKSITKDDVTDLLEEVFKPDRFVTSVVRSA